MNNEIKHDKYSVLVFSNGRVVFYENELLNEAVKNDKELLFVCNAWGGGCAHAIGANEIADMIWGDTEEGWSVYEYDVKETEFDEEDLKKFYKIIFTEGCQIIMNTGAQANKYSDVFCKFYDWDSLDDDGLSEKENLRIRSEIDEIATIYELKRKEKDWAEKAWALWGRGIIGDRAMKEFGLLK